MNPLRTFEPLVSNSDEAAPSSQWDSALIRTMITENSESGSRPAFLILGKCESDMLREHLGNAFGPAAVQCLKNTYYMGLLVVEDPATSILCVAGRKSASSSTAKTGLGKSASLESGSRWRFSA
jgi:hypothetical protein